MKILAKITGLIILISSASCDKPLIGYKYNEGSLPETPINLSDFNTAFDDYNSTAPSLGELIPFCFSTNRMTNGNEFNVIYQPMNVNFNKTSGILKVTNEYDNWESIRNDYTSIQTGLNKIKSRGNEFGPNLLVEYGLLDITFTLLYSTDITGNTQINYISNKTDLNFSDPKEVQFLNSEFEDMYPSFNADKSKIYFCSNRSGDNFDIFHVDINPEKEMEVLLAEDTNYEIIKDETLSSNSDDKCPFVLGNKLVFASNRAGGYGGFDLYYCILENGEWSAPINFGEKINSELDEYRPILIEEGVSWEETMMVFSSNRTGGMGGFDLYFVGIEKE